MLDNMGKGSRVGSISASIQTLLCRGDVSIGAPDVAVTREYCVTEQSRPSIHVSNVQPMWLLRPWHACCRHCLIGQIPRQLIGSQVMAALANRARSLLLDSLSPGHDSRYRPCRYSDSLLAYMCTSTCILRVLCPTYRYMYMYLPDVRACGGASLPVPRCLHGHTYMYIPYAWPSFCLC